MEEKSEMLIAYHLKNSFRLVSFFLNWKEKKSTYHIELEKIRDDKEAQSILWKASKILGQHTKKMDVIFNK